MPTKLLTLVIEDADGDKSSVSVYVGDSGTGGVEDENSFLDTFLQPWWDAIRPLIDGVLVGAYVRLSYDLSNFTNNSPLTSSDIEEKAVFILQPCDQQKRVVRFSLPTVKESIFTNSGAGKEIDITNSDVGIFIHLMTNDLGGGGIDPLDSHGNELCNYIQGEQSFGKG